MLVSSAEPSSLRALGEFSPLCEQLGCDFLLLTKSGIIGIQRKTQADLLASLRSSDRIARELPMMQSDSIAQAILLIEGELAPKAYGAPRWAKQGFSRAEYNGIRLSVQQLGIWIVETVDLEDTANTLLQMQTFFDKSEHNSLLRRPKPKRSTDPARDAAIHLMQSVPKWGYKQCALLYDHYGYAPIVCTVTETELKAIPGIGPVRAKAFVDHFRGSNGRG